MNPFYQDILRQPEVLRDLIAYYQTIEGEARLRAVQRPRQVLLTGMGASYHAALYASYLLQSLNIPSVALEASNLINFNHPLLEWFDMLIFISQSGASAEVQPLLDMLPPSLGLVAVTNQPDRPLGLQAKHVLTLNAGVETTVAAKTYLNSLAILWLLAQGWAGQAAYAFDALRETADAVQALVTDEAAIVSDWLGRLEDQDSLIFLGHGPHVATARQAAMMLAEWAKLPAQAMSIGAFRHGFIEMVNDRSGIVLFGEGGSTRTSTRGLIDELSGYGAAVLSVVNGRTAPTLNGDYRAGDYLAPLLDVVPAQFFAEQMARTFNVQPGFRYIQKVVRQL